jgi:hypothetical protein
VLRDEVRHRDFGWDLLDWLLEQPTRDGLRELVRAELPLMFARLRASYAPAGATETTIAVDDRAWGLMPTARYAAIIRQVFERDYVPRFRARGIDARAAWGGG